MILKFSASKRIDLSHLPFTNKQVERADSKFALVSPIRNRDHSFVRALSTIPLRNRPIYIQAQFIFLINFLIAVGEILSPKIA